MTDTAKNEAVPAVIIRDDCEPFVLTVVDELPGDACVLVAVRPGTPSDALFQAMMTIRGISLNSGTPDGAADLAKRWPKGTVGVSTRIDLRLTLEPTSDVPAPDLGGEVAWEYPHVGVKYADLERERVKAEIRAENEQRAAEERAAEEARAKREAEALAEAERLRAELERERDAREAAEAQLAARETLPAPASMQDGAEPAEHASAAETPLDGPADEPGAMPPPLPSRRQRARGEG